MCVVKDVGVVLERRTRMEIQRAGQARQLRLPVRQVVYRECCDNIKRGGPGGIDSAGAILNRTMASRCARICCIAK
jgi:hypothetical protein